MSNLRHSSFRLPDLSSVSGIACCDRCDPKIYDVLGLCTARTKKKRAARNPFPRGVIQESVKLALQQWRTDILAAFHPNALYGPSVVLPDTLVDVIASIGPINSIKILEQGLPAHQWTFWKEHGQRLYTFLSTKVDIPAFEALPSKASKKRKADAQLTPENAADSESDMTGSPNSSAEASKRPRCDEALVAAPRTATPQGMPYPTPAATPTLMSATSTTAYGSTPIRIQQPQYYTPSVASALSSYYAAWQQHGGQSAMMSPMGPRVTALRLGDGPNTPARPHPPPQYPAIPQGNMGERFGETRSSQHPSFTVAHLNATLPTPPPSPFPQQSGALVASSNAPMQAKPRRAPAVWIRGGQTVASPSTGSQSGGAAGSAPL